uniref:Uncharacterized protein n=1 Tax=viral metagenome TaxID=1070528 RepID=A0A6C0CIN1_9ZZZZ
MDTTKIFQQFVDDIKKTFPSEEPVVDVEKDVKYFETLFPSALKIFQRDDGFFIEEPRRMFGVNMTDLWLRAGDSKELFWKHMQASLLGSFMHGDIKEKIGPMIDVIKKVLSGTGNQSDEINKILEDKNSESHFKRILDYVMDTRIAKVFMQVVEEIDIKELELNFDNPQEILDMVRNPEHPTMQRVIQKLQAIVKDKVQKGNLTQQQILREIEGIKAKITSVFGNVFNEALGGTQSEIPSSVMMGNSPEARRQRMLARLQKKQREKNSR